MTLSKCGSQARRPKINPDQVGQLNLWRLASAQLVAGDYLAKTNRVELSPHYVEILDHLTKFSKNTLRPGLFLCTSGIF